MQERLASPLTENFIVHNTTIQHFIINIHAFHNTHLIRAILPRSLTVPIPFTLDRYAYHLETAAKLRLSQDGRRAATAEKIRKKKVDTASAATQSARKRQRADGGGEEEGDGMLDRD